MITILQTETTDLILDYDNLLNPENPHILSLSAVGMTADGRIVHTAHHLIRPDGWRVPVGAIESHGINLNVLEAVGVPFVSVMPAVAEMCRNSEAIVAYNAYFHANAILIEASRYGFDHGMSAEKLYCFMNVATNVAIRLSGDPNIPYLKMEEAYFLVMGKTVAGEELGEPGDAEYPAPSTDWSTIKRLDFLRERSGSFPWHIHRDDVDDNEIGSPVPLKAYLIMEMVFAARQRQLWTWAPVSTGHGSSSGF